LAHAVGSLRPRRGGIVQLKPYQGTSSARRFNRHTAMDPEIPLR